MQNIKVSASANSEVSSTVGLGGYAINAVKSEYLDLSELKDGLPIFVNGYIENKTISKSIVTNSFSTSLGYSSTITGSYDVFTANLSLEDFSESKLLVIRYGASGEGEDTWKNKNLKVHIQYKK